MFFCLTFNRFWLNLQDSGLTVISNTNIRVSRRDDTGCNRISRKRRSSGTLFYWFLQNYYFWPNVYISLIFTDELTRIIDNHPCCVAGDLFGRNVTGEGECFEEGKSVFNLTGSTGCSKVFYKCCKRYLQNGPQYSGCQFKIHKMSVKDFNRICQLKLLLSYFFI